jgi:hypothetical protein
MVGNFAQLFPEVLAKINGMGIIEQLIESVGMDIDRSLLDDESIYDDEFENVAEEIMLGHNINVPEGETRKESLKRLRFLTELKRREKFEKLQEKAFSFHLMRTMDNITRDHSTDILKETGKKPGQDASAPQSPLMGQPNMPQGSAIAQPQGKPQLMNMPSPDERLLKGTAPEALV